MVLWLLAELDATDKMANYYHRYDLPDAVRFSGDSIAVDTEAMGLNNHRDRLCVVQVSDGQGDAHIVHFPEPKYEAPNLRKYLGDEALLKLFHFGRFDMAIIRYYMGIVLKNVYCTKIASRLCRTFTDYHSLKALCSDLLDVSLPKLYGSSYWGGDRLSKGQIDYAASDVLYLHALKQELDKMLEREDRLDLAQRCYDFLHTRVELDLLGWPEDDIFLHS